MTRTELPGALVLGGASSSAQTCLRFGSILNPPSSSIAAIASPRKRHWTFAPVWWMFLPERLSGEMQKNCYLVLGVEATATPAEIKAAFRRRAMEVYPDRFGSESVAFQELQDAYAVLSHPDRRRHYDRHSPPAPMCRAPRGPAPEPVPRWPGGDEPIAAPAPEFHEIAIAESAATFHPSFEELFARLWGNFEDRPRPKSETLENLTLEVVVTAEEALVGGRVRVQVPGLATCPTCGGHGGLGTYQCWRCAGAGAVALNYPLEIAYPPGIRDGHATRISLNRFGIYNLYLTILFRVTDTELAN